MRWVDAVKEWNSGQPFKDDLYGIPKRGGDYYDDVKAIMESSKHKKNVETMMGKKPEPEPEPVKKIEDKKEKTPSEKEKQLLQELRQTMIGGNVINPTEYERINNELEKLRSQNEEFEDLNTTASKTVQLDIKKNKLKEIQEEKKKLY